MISRRKKLLLWVVGLPVLLIVSYVVIELIRGPVEADPRKTVFDVPPDGGDADSAEHPTDPLYVSLTLEGGQFDVKPAEPGQPLHVEADYDAGSHYLGHESVIDTEGQHRFTLDFGSRVSMVRQLLSTRTFRLENRINVYLPTETPLHLSIHVGRGQHDIDLSGLALTHLEFRADSGQTNLEFHEPNPISLELMRIESTKGQLKTRGLGYANARDLQFRGSMGQNVLDFRGRSRGETRAAIRMSMGSARILLPSDRRINYEASRTFVGKVSVPEASGIRGLTESPELVDTLSLDLSASFGEIDVRR